MFFFPFYDDLSPPKAFGGIKMFDSSPGELCSSSFGISSTLFNVQTTYLLCDFWKCVSSHTMEAVFLRRH